MITSIDDYEWSVLEGTFHTWYWSTGNIGNGWSALVSDVSQMYAPKRPTEYSASACCRWWIVSHPQTFKTLREAKAAALALALRQREAGANPACRVKYGDA